MYTPNSFGLREPWATIERWCGPLLNTSWYNNVGMVVITIFEGKRCRYSIPLGTVETVVGWGRAEFQVQIAWRRHREDAPSGLLHREPAGRRQYARTDIRSPQREPRAKADRARLC